MIKRSLTGEFKQIIHCSWLRRRANIFKQAALAGEEVEVREEGGGGSRGGGRRGGGGGAHEPVGRVHDKLPKGEINYENGY